MSKEEYTAIRIGGSLAEGEVVPGKTLKPLAAVLSSLSTEHLLLLFSGGGMFAEFVRHESMRYNVDEFTAHWMAIAAVDQYAYLLSSMIPQATIVRSLSFLQNPAQSPRLPLLAPGHLLAATDVLPHTWDVTTDAIAAWICHMAGIHRLILLKDVDGVYEHDPAQHSQGKISGDQPRLFSTLTPQQLSEYRIVDAHLPRFLKDSRVSVWIVNGHHPERLQELFSTGRTTGTFISKVEGKLNDNN